MHFSHELLLLMVAFLAGGFLGLISGFCLFGAWTAGWIFPATVPESLAKGDTTVSAACGGEGQGGWPPAYEFDVDHLGNVTYRESPGTISAGFAGVVPPADQIPYAGDGEG